MKKQTIIALIACLLIIGCTMKPSLKLTPEDVKPESDYQKKFDGEIFNATGYNWESISFKQDNSDEETLAALLMVVREQDSSFQQFAYVQRSYGISDEEIKNFELNNVTNILQLLDQLEYLQNFYYKKGMVSSEINLKRIIFLKKYFLRKNPGDTQVTGLAIKILGPDPPKTQKEIVIWAIERQN